MALKLYEANPGPQARFHETPKRLRFLFGGNRSGKSTAGAVEALRFALGNHPHRPVVTRPASGWVISPTFEVQRESAQTLIRRYLPTTEVRHVRMVYRDRARDYLDRIEFQVPGRAGFAKVTITFKSAEQGREAFQGPSVAWIWLDEEPPMDVFVECLMRTLDCKGDVWGTMTPIIGELYQYITEDCQDDPELAWWHMTWDHNPYLADDEKARLWAAIPEEERDPRTRGIWAPKSGRVFREWNPGVHVIEPFVIPDSWRRIAGWDYGTRAPAAGVWLAIDPDGTVYVYDEHYQAETTVEAHSKAIHARGVKRIKADSSLWNRLPLIDAPHGKRATALSIAKLFAQNGVHLIPAAKGSGTWEARMDLIRFALRPNPQTNRPSLYVFDTCPNLIREFTRLIWKPSRSGMLHEDTHGPDHAIDALGYALEDLAAVLGRTDRPRIGPCQTAYTPRERVTGY